VRGDPVNAGERQLPGCQIEIELFLQLANQADDRWFVGLDHASGEIPVGLVVRVDEEDPPLLIAQDGVRSNPFPRLLGVALSKVLLPRLGVATIERFVSGHLTRTGVSGASEVIHCWSHTRWRTASARICLVSRISAEPTCGAS
jgi:hypothetical protein